MSESDLQHVWKQAHAIGLFVPAGRELKIPLNQSYSVTQIQALMDWITTVIVVIEKHDLRE